MCRLIAFAASYDGIPELAALIKALARSARMDPYLKALGVEPPTHGDGWGFAVAVLKDGAVRAHHMRYGLPIYVDREGVAGLLKIISSPGVEWVVGVAHARRASKGEPVTWVDAHPFHALMRDGTEVYVAHNGRVDKKALQGPPRRTDTLALTLYLARNPPLVEGIKKLISGGHVETALNLAILSTGRGGTVEAVSLKYVVPGLEERVRRYYGMRLIRCGSYFTAAASVTTAEEYLRINESAGIEELRNGELALISVREGSVIVERQLIINE